MTSTPMPARCPANRLERPVVHLDQFRTLAELRANATDFAPGVVAHARRRHFDLQCLPATLDEQRKWLTGRAAHALDKLPR